MEAVIADSIRTRRFTAPGITSEGNKVKVWQVSREWSIDGMDLVEQPEPRPGAGQIVVRMRAASLNYRDLLTVQGKGGSYKLPIIPFSDGAGEVALVGEGVTRVAVGDRVCPMFFQSWIDGNASESTSRAWWNPTGGTATTDAPRCRRCQPHSL
jgi:NADPH:quinone reductase-like Zn-dependent oxidoreductase